MYLDLNVAYKTFNFTEAKSRMVATSRVEIAEWEDAGQKTQEFGLERKIQFLMHKSLEEKNAAFQMQCSSWRKFKDANRGRKHSSQDLKR